ncbi:MAG: hypothetical protein R3F13_11780 [Prosthecobacter sp.]
MSALLDPATIEKQARMMAEEARLNDPGITGVLFFPTNQEVRLIEVVSDVPAVSGERVNVFYFNPAPDSGMPALSGIGVIRPDDLGKVALPEGWGDWEDGVQLYSEQAA